MKRYLSSAAAAIVLMGGIGAALADTIVVKPEQETVVRE